MCNLISNGENQNYYKSCLLRLTSINAKMDAHLSNHLELCLTVTDEDQINDKWMIKAIDVASIKGIFALSYLPFFEMNITEDLPILWVYKYENIHFKLSGLSKLDQSNFLKLIGKISTIYHNELGGFLRWEDDFRGLIFQRDKDKIGFSINSKTFEYVKDVFDEFGLTLNLREDDFSKNQKYLDELGMKALTIINPHISKKDYFWHQYHVIAKDFNFTKIA